MPLYEYECESCGARFELIHRFTDAPAEKCKTCGGGPVRRLLSAPAIQFKGSGWYITDYARKGKSETPSETPSGPPTGDSKSGSTSEGGSSDTKPAASPTTTTTTETKSATTDSK